MRSASPEMRDSMHYVSGETYVVGAKVYRPLSLHRTALKLPISFLPNVKYISTSIYLCLCFKYNS